MIIEGRQPGGLVVRFFVRGKMMFDGVVNQYGMLSILTCFLRMGTVCLLFEQVDVIFVMNWLELNQVFTNCFDKFVQCVADCKSSSDVKVVLFLTLKMLWIRDSCLPVKLGSL